MDKNKVCAILYYVAAFFYLLSAVLDFISSRDGSGTFDLCFCAVFLSLGSVYLGKNKKGKNDNDKKDNNQ